ncbi:hypothetical protein M407DRAFT_31850 [Tulasnella calospora MUT 4182]|uniref:Uncharacterized protein n=1 Tax=Tulasnella calospora MUT 4182 TaxID=1051891 RepID=A0A0C3KAP0_9AGAM|nr:hypothetical protein M407DRAFT_31850 [Tulasnella calospora MUT 4182]
MSSPPELAATGAKPKKPTRTTCGQLAVKAAATGNPEVGEVTTANGRKLRKDTMATKNGRVAENILREQTLDRKSRYRGKSSPHHTLRRKIPPATTDTIDTDTDSAADLDTDHVNNKVNMEHAIKTTPSLHYNPTTRALAALILYLYT